MVPSCNRLTSNLDEPPQELVSKELVSSAGFQGILVESHYHKENINLSYPPTILMVPKPILLLRQGRRGGRGWIRTIGARRHGSLAGSWIKPSLPHDHMAAVVGFEPTGVLPHR